jgi:O-antigen/teichoic acid export membrane protein
MADSLEQSGHRLLKGITRVSGGETLSLGLALLIAIVLTRSLGPTGYGVYFLAVSLVFWLELVCGAMFTRPLVHFVAAAPDWRALGSLALRMHLITGLAGGALLFFSAPALAALFHQPVLESVLRLFALDIPLFSLVMAHRSILMGLGRHNPRALGPVVRWLVRLILVALFIALGFSIHGAVAAIIAGSVAELMIYRYFARPPLWLKAPMGIADFAGFSIPLFLVSISSAVFLRLDLIMLGALLASSHWAGLYGAALSFCMPLRMMSHALSPLLLSNLTRMYENGEKEAARQRIKQAWQVTLWLLPGVGVAASAAPEIMVLVYGQAYESGGLVLYWLVFASWLYFIIACGIVMLTSIGKPLRVLYAVGWLPLAAFAGHVWLIPGSAGLGAAMVTALFSLAGALAVIQQVWQCWRVLPSLKSTLKCLALSAVLFALGYVWPTPNFWVFAKISLLGLAALGGLVASGECSLEQIRQTVSLALGRKPLRQGA